MAHLHCYLELKRGYCGVYKKTQLLSKSGSYFCVSKLNKNNIKKINILNVKIIDRIYLYLKSNY